MRPPLALVASAALLLSSCGRYRDFTLPPQKSGEASFAITWTAQPGPVLTPGATGEWDSVDVLNPSVVRLGREYFNFYSGFDGTRWHTGIATSQDGLGWRKLGRILSPQSSRDYIAANGAAVPFRNSLLYYYQSGRIPRIGLATVESLRVASTAIVLEPGPWDSWDERGVADPYVIEQNGRLYMYYTGMDRARRQRLGVATSEDGHTWYKFRGNPVMELGGYGDFDENGLGEPAVWSHQGSYWMLYTGRAHNEVRRLGLARSEDGVHWKRLPDVFHGEQSWDAKVICDPSVLVDGGRIRVWFGGGNVARPDENLHGKIGYSELTIVRH